MKTGLYIHVPFCHEKCDYCSFYSIPVKGRDDFSLLAEAFTSRVSEEIKEILGKGSYSVDTIYFGGGTPVLLSPEMLNKIFAAIDENAFREEGCEISIETNPGVTRAARLHELRDLGFTRVTMGLQTIDPGAHHVIGRQGATCSVETLDDYFSVKGIDLCLDVIAGIPGHSSGAYHEQLDAILAYFPPHLSVYLLSIEEGTPLGRRMKEDETLEAHQRESFLETRKQLTGRGYRHYEISNYALPGKESRHNLKYYRYQPYAGFGPGAHSFLMNRRWSNAPDVKAYLKGGEFKRNEDPRSREQCMVEFFMMGLRLLDGIRIIDFEAVFGEEIPAPVVDAVDKLSVEGLLKVTSGIMALTESAVITADRVIYRTVEPLLLD